MAAPRPLLSRIRLARLASAFELTTPEVVTDATTILGWSGCGADLERLLNSRHGWCTDEAFHFVRNVRLQVWCTWNGIAEIPGHFQT
jgi:hypothetical protein